MQKSEPNGPWGISVIVDFEIKTTHNRDAYAETALILVVGYVFNHAKGVTELELKRLEKDVERSMEATLSWIHKPKVTLSFQPPEAQAEDEQT